MGVLAGLETSLAAVEVVAHSDLTSSTVPPPLSRPGNSYMLLSLICMPGSKTAVFYDV